MAAAFDLAGFEAVDVHMSDLIHGRHRLDAFQGFVACGGFSYGDVLGAGRGWAKSILFNQPLRDEFSAFLARDDRFALGVCNGCQMLSNLKSLIPAGYVGLAWNVENPGDYPGWSFCSGFSSQAISKKAGIPLNACSGLPPDEHTDPAASVTFNKFNRFGAVASTGAYYWYLGETTIPLEDVAPYIPSSLDELPGWLDRVGLR